MSETEPFMHIRMSDDGLHIRKWSPDPFDGGIALYAKAPAVSREGVLEEAAKDLLANMGSTYRAKNGRQVGVQGDDGEKVWLVHSDYITALEAALSTVAVSETPPDDHQQNLSSVGDRQKLLEDALRPFANASGIEFIHGDDEIRMVLSYPVDRPTGANLNSLTRAKEALSTVPASEPAAGWREIGIAPKDGTAVLAMLCGSDLHTVIRYRDGNWIVAWDDYNLSDPLDRPTHWMPLPTPPGKMGGGE